MHVTNTSCRKSHHIDLNIIFVLFRCRLEEGDQNAELLPSLNELEASKLNGKTLKKSREKRKGRTVKGIWLLVSRPSRQQVRNSILGPTVMGAAVEMRHNDPPGTSDSPKNFRSASEKCISALLLKFHNSSRSKRVQNLPKGKRIFLLKSQRNFDQKFFRFLTGIRSFERLKTSTFSSFRSR